MFEWQPETVCFTLLLEDGQQEKTTYKRSGSKYQVSIFFSSDGKTISMGSISLQDLYHAWNLVEGDDSIIIKVD